MSQTAITKRITTVSEAEKQFNLVRTADLNFFSECRENLSDLTDAEKAVLDRIKARYRKGHLAEGLVNLVVLSPLLELAGFYDSLFQKYDIYRIFSHLPLQNEFYDVLQILKRLGKNIEEIDTS